MSHLVQKKKKKLKKSFGLRLGNAFESSLCIYFIVINLSNIFVNFVIMKQITLKRLFSAVYSFQSWFLFKNKLLFVYKYLYIKTYYFTYMECKIGLMEKN